MASSNKRRRRPVPLNPDGIFGAGVDTDDLFFQLRLLRTGLGAGEIKIKLPRGILCVFALKHYYRSYNPTFPTR